jgi:hypothetical protein
MWARNIDGVIMISEDLAERIKEIAVPGLAFTANEKTYTLGKSMDLERTGDDDRFWFYTSDEAHALFLHLLGSENIYEVGIMERKMYWFGAIKETTLPITSLSFPGLDFVIAKNEIKEPGE